MTQYVLRIGRNPYVERVVEAAGDAEVFAIARTAIAAFCDSSAPPPPHIELTVMDARRNTIGVLEL